ncbi:flagellar hook-associated protein FlgK [Nocardioides sp.]|uniref:flagellar hook-associated protein FlgK n=1 Tax=Nocardioides sp. TaxID=35761 RepID=UPI00273512D1|nr:flagellar hook-associated protein FlgK [Nocardioides sp.]MDP3894536.1 flagellar hook-associated protein FlgK [Nocardioides sp.]
MSGTFSSLNTALSALRYNAVVLDVASNNVANVGTDGYTRRQVAGASVGAPPTTAMWSRYVGSGDGVRVAGLTRMADAFLDARARIEHGNQSYLDVRQAVLQRVESGIGEPGENGVAAALADFRTAWADLANNPGESAARAQVLAQAGALADALGIQARNIATEESDQRSKLLSLLGEVNTVAGDLAAVNRSITNATLGGGDAGILLDQRDQLALRLAQLTGAQGTIRPDGGMDVTLNGIALVTGQDAASLTITSGITPAGAPDGGPLTFAVVAGATSTPMATGMRGEAGAVADLLTTTLPAYAAGLDAIATSLADQVNARHTAGFDLAGNPGVAFFSYDPTNAAASLAVALTSPDQVAASGVPGGVLDGSNADLLSNALAAEGDYQRLVNGFGSEVASVRRLALNQRTLTAQVDGSREQLRGVNLDEEMVTMLSAQRAYEAAARVMTTLDSVLDTLINRTGLLR